MLFLFLIVSSGCASVPTNGHEVDEIDPYEDINRISYDITDTVDRMILEPIVDVYVEYVPNGTQRSVGNFYDNLSYPNVALNALLQGKARQGFRDSLRFVVNSTVGLLGLFDMATHMGLEKNNEDFGQTLGVWGVDASTYGFIPFYGPTSNRDVADIPVSVVTNILFYASYMVSATVFAPLTVLSAIDKRARMSGPMQIRDQAALDPYLFVREAYLQNREYLVHDGNVPPVIYDDPMH
ncbi:MAG: VacJ family lipoprotein [Nitrosomonas sp.]|nr:VacJ family lipoprotein [Nitrosomonas sp.]